ncbi:ABC transporter substrate-binding protein [Actinoallomurus bryophytorum]|uniref:Amino acid/amide ABC transporter substrate-binding protein (HAAT family) n=1 Tax=Actinoallomurus bryophytorum TaxID=1490222 RepID=A0A543C1N1_9ACTN|nr:ABC transporter substrate-binding protein [Actinoallomurus bryophytorum]TQL90946.1 amino acid/amide ABC transporter substrate-binding protein (HAAT family) [Actinoallomurus bryophytorum]
MALTGRIFMRTTASAFVLSLSLAACGSGVAIQKKPSHTTGGDITLGAPYPLTGVWAENGQNSLRGLKLAVDEINAAGGIHALGGAKLRVVSADTGSTDPSQAQTATTKLITTDHAAAIVGCFLSSMSLTASTVAERQHVPFVTQSLIDQLVQRGYKYTFRLPAGTSATGPAAVKDYLALAKGRTPKNVAVFSSNDAASKAQSETLRTYAAQQGLKVTDYQLYTPGLTDAGPIVTALAASHADAIFGAGSAADLTLIIKGLRARGVKTPVVGSGGTGFLGADLGSSLGPDVNGILAISGWNDDLKLPGVQQVAQRYHGAYGAPFMPNEAGETWVAVHLVAAAMEKAASTDPAKVATALRQAPFTSGEPSSMPPGKVGFDATGANAAVTPIMIQWQDGRPRTVWPASLATTPVRR